MKCLKVIRTNSIYSVWSLSLLRRWDEGECDTGREESILVRHRALARPLVHMWGFGEYVG